jgi:hypothetical protein
LARVLDWEHSAADAQRQKLERVHERHELSRVRCQDLLAEANKPFAVDRHEGITAPTSP